MSAHAAEGRFRLVLALAGIGIFLMLLEASGKQGEELMSPADRLTARLTAGLVGVSGLSVARDGAVLSHPDGFSYEIYYECSEWLVVLCMAAGLAALPGRGKLPFALAGAALLVVLNQTRLVHLFWTGVHWPAGFDLMHKYVWEPVMLLSVFALWVMWLQRPRQEVSR